MSTKELEINVIKSLSEEKLKAFLTLFADENMIAHLESDMLANDPTAKRYSSFQEFIDRTEQDSV